MAPGFDYYRNPYENQSNTGAARQLQREQTMRRLERDLQELDYKLHSIDGKVCPLKTRYNDGSIYVSPHMADYFPPEPSVETHESTPPEWWVKLVNDPIWEMFKRPRIKV